MNRKSCVLTGNITLLQNTGGLSQCYIELLSVSIDTKLSVNSEKN